MTTSRCVSHCPTCCGSAATLPKRSHRLRRLDSGKLVRIGCLVLDLAMPGMSGPELHQELRRRGQLVPIVFITATADKTVRPHLLAQGAVDCLFKPFSDTALLAAISAAEHVA
jgi:FixJ family two-component response regulator